MNWVLESGGQRIGITGGRVIGRDDFPSNEQLSRKHFEVLVNEDVCLIKDLDSRNGTFINGKRLKPNKNYKLNTEDVLKAGDMEFACSPGELGFNALKTLCISSGVITVALFAALINGRGMDHGRGIGLWNDFTLFTILFFSVAFLSAVFRFVASAQFWSGKIVTLHFVVVLFGSIFVNDALLSFAYDKISLGENIGEAKIEYYCVNHFNPRTCINEISYCPQCAHHMPKTVRTEILKRITPFQREVAAYAAAEAKRKPASIIPDGSSHQ